MKKEGINIVANKGEDILFSANLKLLDLPDPLFLTKNEMELSYKRRKKSENY